MGRYKIIAEHYTAKGILDTKTGTRISNLWDHIERCGLIEGKSEYYLVQDKYSKWAIFHKDNPNQPITQWWYGIEKDGLAEGESEYYIVANKYDPQYAIFHKDNPNEPITQWWKKIKASGVLKNKSEYYIAENQNYQQAIFHKDNPYVSISHWWKEIEAPGLLKGTSKYYIATRQHWDTAIFHIDNPDEPVSKSNIYISKQGLVNGQSNYYIARNHNWQCAIFYKDDPDTAISKYWDNIYSYGLVSNQSEYYIAEMQNRQQAIFHINNPDKPITNLHRYIYPFGLVNGSSECYATLSQKDPVIQIYHPNDISQPLYELPKKQIESVLLYVNSEYALYLGQHHLMMYDAINMQHKDIGALPKNLQSITQKIYYQTSEYAVATTTTSRLISDYMHHGFMPIVIKNYRSKHTHNYLLTADGNYIQKFDNTQEMIEYIQQEISKKTSSYDMLRLY